MGDEQPGAAQQDDAPKWGDSLDKLSQERKGGIRRLLDEKWAKAYKASAPRGLFSHPEMRAA